MDRERAMARGYLSPGQWIAERENSSGTQDAKITARSMINSWLKQQRSTLKKAKT
jgi:hypothetical protein